MLVDPRTESLVLNVPDPLTLRKMRLAARKLGRGSAEAADWGMRVVHTPAHQLLVETTLGEWVSAPPYVRARLTIKLMKYLKVDMTKIPASQALEWLEAKENARGARAR